MGLFKKLKKKKDWHNSQLDELGKIIKKGRPATKEETDSVNKYIEKHKMTQAEFEEFWEKDTEFFTENKNETNNE